MRYIMECEEENNRLDFQEKIETYKIKHDLIRFDINSEHHVLDAGCGSGTVTRYLSHTFGLKKIDGCDISHDRLNQAISASSLHQINFFQSSLDNIKVKDNTYDRIVCRFVYEYLPDPLKVTKEFHRILKPNGKICLIDLDGMLFNLYHQNIILKDYLDKIKIGFETKYKVDLFVGRKLRFFLQETGFKNITHSARTMVFEAEELQKEIENFRIRFENAYQMYDDILGLKDAAHFKELYLEELNRNGNVIFYNNFSVIGEK